MTIFEKKVEVEHASYECKTLGDLLEKFSVNLTYFMNDKKKSFSVTDNNLKSIYTDYYILTFYENPLHVFEGYVEEYPDNNIIYILDILHHRIYRIEEGFSQTFTEYILDGKEIKKVNINHSGLEEILKKYAVRDYLCYNIGELLDSFNLDISLPDKLRNHIIIRKDNQDCDYASDLKILFNDYSIMEFDKTKLYVFKSIYDSNTLILDSNPPVYYIDPDNQYVYIETNGMVGTCILQFDKENEIINDAHSWDIDIKVFIRIINKKS